MISVIVTVGPNPVYQKYLPECIRSIREQDFEDQVEIVLIDDASHIDDNLYRGLDLTYKKLEWNLGQAAAINIGCLTAAHDWLFIMGGSDDRLMPNCLSTCFQTYQDHKTKWACYSPILITSEGETSSLPQGAWLIHREVWSKLGGYPREAGIGEVDSIFGSIMLKQDVVMYSCGTEPTYWHREHPQALSAVKSSARHEAAGIIRSMCTNEWQKPEWIKGYGY